MKKGLLALSPLVPLVAALLVSGQAFAQNPAAGKAAPPPSPADPSTPTAATGGLQTQPEPTAAELEQRLEEDEKEIEALKRQADSFRPGTSKFLLTGYAFGEYTAPEGDDSSFNSGFNPIFLWKLGDRLLTEAELEVELEENEAVVDLEYAHVTYLVTDYVTLGVGKFLAPFGIFSERLHPAWINKLPSAPIAFGHDGVAPPSILGFQLRGGAPLGRSKFSYAVYLSNGPRLNSGEEEPEEAGILHFDNNFDVDRNKALGGRVGFLPVPALEIGYSLQTAKIDATGTSRGDVRATLQAADLTWIGDFDAIAGALDLRAEWVWSDVDDATYDPDGELGFGPLTFDNKRRGGYAQLAYRPSKAGPFVKNLEFVTRYDVLDNPREAPESVDAKRWTFGLDYWVSPSAVLKLAYETRRNEEEEGGKDTVTGVLIQAAIGF